MGFNNTWIFLNDVLPRAIKKYGGFDAEALRKAALETDIPVGGTMQGYGVKFYPPGHRWPARTSAPSPVVMQYVDGKPRSLGRRSCRPSSRCCRSRRACLRAFAPSRGSCAPTASSATRPTLLADAPRSVKVLS